MTTAAYVDSYPTQLLTGCETALILFSAAFGGRQDAHFIAEAGLVGTCVDEDAAKLAEMEPNYPDGWAFVTADVFEFVATTDGMWDVVSADPWTQDFAATAEILPGLCRLARHAVILGTGVGTTVSPPTGWSRSGRRRRSDYDGGVFWTILEPRP